MMARVIARAVVRPRTEQAKYTLSRSSTQRVRCWNPCMKLTIRGCHPRAMARSCILFCASGRCVRRSAGAQHVNKTMSCGTPWMTRLTHRNVARSIGANVKGRPAWPAVICAGGTKLLWEELAVFEVSSAKRRKKSDRRAAAVSPAALHSLILFRVMFRLVSHSLTLYTVYISRSRPEIRPERQSRGRAAPASAAASDVV
jgi:hypothetical protein